MSTRLPHDYAVRAYAGVLGKIIGVYLGRPFEGWWYKRLTEVFGARGVDYYVNNRAEYINATIRKKAAPLIVTDDDITGTFAFFRALEDHGFDAKLTARQIGHTWMNYLIEGKTVLWWGGMGMSTEHTAYLRMKHGIEAPESGSIARNGTVVAEQIGAQIFIDGWGLACPGNPGQAAAFARAAGSVSHDGEAVHGAVVIAAMEAEAFVNPELNHLLDVGVSFIPKDSLIARLIGDLRQWHKEDADWHKTYQRVHDLYGYDRYGGNCHMIPNHALIILALLYAPDSFSEALRIVNTCGWDTDCNSANVGCIQGVRLGLDALNREHDWRGPVADRLFLPTAEGGRAISDAVTETQRIIKAARALAGEAYTAPKGGARYHFSLPGSVQGFLPIDNGLGQPTAVLGNVVSPQSLEASRCLNIRMDALQAVQVSGVYVNTYFTPEEAAMEGYGLIGNPTLHAGQTVVADVQSCHQSAGDIRARLAVVYYGPEDKPVTAAGEWVGFAPGQKQTMRFAVPDTQGHAVFQLRLEFVGQAPCATVRVESVRFEGTPSTALFSTLPVSVDSGKMWHNAWVDAMDRLWRAGNPELPARQQLYAMRNEGWGSISMGSEAWRRYRFEAVVGAHLADAIGIGVAYRGLRSAIRMVLDAGGTVRLQRLHMDGTVQELATARAGFELYRDYHFALEWDGGTVRGMLDGKEVIGPTAIANPPEGGGVAIYVDTGRALLSGAKITALG